MLLQIRREQMQAFEQSALRNFEVEMVEHLREFAPRHCEVIGEAGVHEVIRLGIDRAGRYGLTNRGPVRFYIELMFMFGSDFDTDPQLPWVAWILHGTWISDQMGRAERLYEKTIHYLDNVAGPDNKYAISAMQGIRQAWEEGFRLSDEIFESAILSEMKRIHPQKCEYLGDPPLQTLIQRGTELAKRYSVTFDKGLALFIGLMFALGHGFAADPLFPWISKTLNDATIADPETRVERLGSRVMVYLDHALTYLKQG